MTDDEDRMANRKAGDGGVSTECVTLRHIAPVKLASAMTGAPAFAATTEVDRPALSDITDPEARVVSEGRPTAPELRSSDLDLLTTADLRPLVAKMRAVDELRPSAPELEEMLAPPTFDAPTPQGSGRIARAFRADTASEPESRPTGASTQLSIAPRMTPRSVAILARGTIVGEYEVDRKIGQGAMSEVYSAVHRTIGRRVAIKVVSPRLFDDPDAEARFVREARAVAAIHHPGIVDVFGFGTLDDGRMYLIMEWLHGRSLSARLHEGPLAVAAACDLILQITSALRAAHDQGIVHRDLKPDNVFLQEIDDEKPIVKILDFGLAKRTGQQMLSHTRTGQLIGTPLYISPEQARGKDVDESTDIYALGCIAYQLYTGRPPFLADNIADLLSCHLNEKPQAPRSIVPDLPLELDALLQRMIEKDTTRRPSLAQVRRAMQSFLGAGTSMAAVVPEPPATDSRLPLAAPAAASSPPGVLESRDDDSLETQEIPGRHPIDEVDAGSTAESLRPSTRSQAVASEGRAPSRVIVIALWLVLVVSIAIVIWLVTQ